MGATLPSRIVTVAASSPTVTMMVATIVSPTSPPHDVDMCSPTCTTQTTHSDTDTVMLSDVNMISQPAVVRLCIALYLYNIVGIHGLLLSNNAMRAHVKPANQAEKRNNKMRLPKRQNRQRHKK